MKHLYLFIDIFSILLPFLFSFHPKILFYKKWKYALPAIAVSAVLFIIWDIYYTKLGVWGFNPLYLSGVYVFNLPIEEVLFFICIPYSCLFVYEIVNNSGIYFIKRLPEKTISIILSVTLLLIAFFNITKLYTSVTFILTAAALIILNFIIKANFLKQFYGAFLFILIPFFIVNGILTGSFIEEEVVWYNSTEHLNIRLFTIPIEDTFYGMLLILLNVWIYEKLQKSKN